MFLQSLFLTYIYLKPSAKVSNHIHKLTSKKGTRVRNNSHLCIFEKPLQTIALVKALLRLVSFLLVLFLAIKGFGFAKN